MIPFAGQHDIWRCCVLGQGGWTLPCNFEILLAISGLFASMQRWVVTSWVFEIPSHLLFCSLFIWEPLLPPHRQPTGTGAGHGAEDRQGLCKGSEAEG